MPDWDNTESRERDEDAAWRDLVARFDAPLTGQQPVPWPAREDMPAEPARETDGADETDGVRGADGAHGPDGAHGADGRHRGPEADGLDGEHGRHAADGDHGRHAADPEHGRHAADGESGLAGPNGAGLAGPNGRHGSDGPGDRPGGIAGGVPGRHGRLSTDGASDPEVIQVPRRIRGPVARGVPPVDTPEDDEEHYVPPAPPPLPKLDPMAKGAWVALFGGPGYLMVATVAGWSVSGLAAFCAVAAFVAGFAILVLRMHEPGPGGPDDGDDGAVV